MTVDDDDTICLFNQLILNTDNDIDFALNLM